VQDDGAGYRAAHWCGMMVRHTGAEYRCGTLVRDDGATHWCGMMVQHTGAGRCREIVPQSENELSAAKRPDRYYNEIHYPYELMAISTTTTYRVLLKKSPRTTGPYRPVILNHPSSFASRQIMQG